MDLYEYLKTQFTDLETAKRWACTWYQEWDQVLPFEKEAGYTMRAMSAHISNVLEGKTDDDSSTIFWGTSYINTKYGFEVYSAMLDPKWWEDECAPE